MYNLDMCGKVLINIQSFQSYAALHYAYNA